MRKLAVARTAEAIDPAFAQAYTEKRPGFQIGPGVSAAECLTILQAHMRTRLGVSDFAFNVTFGTTPPEVLEGIQHFYPKLGEHDSGRHIDEPQARRELGIVMHHNIQGVGRVVLQLAKPGVVDLMNIEHEGRDRPVVSRRDVDSPQYEGVLAPEMKTVFFEGFTAVSGLVAVTVGATIHDFQSEGAYREWTRYGWEPMAA